MQKAARPWLQTPGVLFAWVMLLWATLAGVPQASCAGAHACCAGHARFAQAAAQPCCALAAAPDVQSVLEISVQTANRATEGATQLAVEGSPVVPAASVASLASARAEAHTAPPHQPPRCAAVLRV
jgi:hypothetical protein